MKATEIFGKLEPEITERLASRREALSGAGKFSALLALGSVPVALSGFARKAYAQDAPSVTDVLNFALTLEYLEAEYYTTGVGASGLIPAEDMSIFQTIQEHEVAHVEFLQGALGSDAVGKPEFDFTAGGAFAPFSD
ncbi:MAG TPA: ferritin-like domain-containing protein, partial [Longimicrobiaceae bacterium]|nr:ferritin-like domain-containing protein [Longimicrobiaceae bacterium]